MRASLSQAPTRVFVVGCPRSGTTLLQTMLGSHPSVHSLPETHFFAHAFPRNRLLRLLTLPAWNVRRRLPELLAELGRTDLLPLARGSLFDRAFAAPFVRILDTIAFDAGHSVWVEKTPLHLHYIAEITKHVPGAKFVHVLRDGLDVVASLYSATNSHPEQWARFARRRRFRGYTLDQCIDRWNHDIALTLRYGVQPNHHVVRYERLVVDPAATLAATCAFLDIRYDPRMHEGETTYTRVVRADEIWKQRNAHPLESRIGAARESLGTSEIEYVRGRLRHYGPELEAFGHAQQLGIRR
jgi:hypothetical protein